MSTLVAPVSASTGGNFEPAPAGNHLSRCVSMIQIGTVTDEFQGKVKSLAKVRLTWELPGEMKEFKEGEGEKPVLVSKTYTHSMYEKATLRAHVDSWRGKGLTNEEADVFDLLKLLGAPCLLNVVHETSKKGYAYAAVKTVATLPKGMNCPPQITPSTVLTYADFDWDIFHSLPEFVRGDMEATPEFQALKKPAGWRPAAGVAAGTMASPQPTARPQAQPQIYANDDNDLPF